MQNPYERVPWPGSPFPQAHISRMAATALLLGMDPPEVSSCRVLELGCGDGSHLIPMALAFPESQFVGIDSAARPLAVAQELAAELGLENITFREADVALLGGQPGECDYLIAHGLYSWVPGATQEKILELCGRLLARSGVAYISYNAYPGWHIRDMTRQMTRIHTDGSDDPGEIRDHALTLLASIYRSTPPGEPTRELIHSEMKRLLGKDAERCYHDDFAEINQPVYFRDFVRRAAAHGLQFLAEADPADVSFLTEHAPEAKEALAAMTDVVEREQYYDFLTSRAFRRTLLCREDTTLDRTLPLERFRGLWYAACLKLSEANPDLESDDPLEAIARTGTSITVQQPFVKAVLFALSNAWPASLSFQMLLDRARAFAPEMNTAEAEEMLREVLLRMHMPGVLELTPAEWPWAKAGCGNKPRASRLARLQAKNGRVTNLRHRSVELNDDLERTLLTVLDGTVTLTEAAEQSSRALVRKVTTKEAEAGVRRLRGLALLEA